MIGVEPHLLELDRPLRISQHLENACDVVGINVAYDQQLKGARFFGRIFVCFLYRCPGAFPAAIDKHAFGSSLYTPGKNECVAVARRKHL